MREEAHFTENVLMVHRQPSTAQALVWLDKCVSRNILDHASGPGSAFLLAVKSMVM